MIAERIIAEVKRLLAEGRLSQNQIARKTGISRSTVQNVANGRRPDYAARRRELTAGGPTGPTQRCPGCGGMVEMPCRLCRARAAVAAGQRAFRLAGKECPPIGVDLQGEERARYEAIRQDRHDTDEQPAPIDSAWDDLDGLDVIDASDEELEAISHDDGVTG